MLLHPSVFITRLLRPHIGGGRISLLLKRQIAYDEYRDAKSERPPLRAPGLGITLSVCVSVTELL